MKIVKGVVVTAASALALAAAGAASAATLHAGNTTVDIYGYVKLDATYDVNQSLGSESYVNLGDVLANKDAKTAAGTNGHFNMTARQSRLGFKIQNDGVTAVIEGDFYGSSTNTYRLRHAYVEWNGILAGQTWTNFNSWNDWIDSLDFDGQAGHAGGFRQPQIRYTTAAGMGKFSISLEQPGTDINTASYAAAAGNAKNQLPDLTVKYEGSANGLDYAVAGLVRQLKYDNNNGSSDSTNGYGVMGSVRYSMANSGTSIMGGLTYGDGIGRYLYLTPLGDGAYVDSSGNLKTIKAWGGTLGLTQKVSATSDVNLGYGITKVDVPSSFSNTQDEKYQTVFLNYLWHPVSNLTYGVEWQHDMARNKGGTTGSANRLQFSTIYNF